MVGLFIVLIVMVVVEVLGLIYMATGFNTFKYIAYLFFPNLRIKAEIREEETRRNNERAQREDEEDRFHEKIRRSFGLNISEINEPESQDEIVRTVNLVACQLSLACVNQDKERREKAVSWETHLDDQVSRLKAKWAEIRKLALQISPDLAERVPHFSEFEPLKSYNAEHLLQKKAKRGIV